MSAVVATRFGGRPAPALAPSPHDHAHYAPRMTSFEDHTPGDHDDPLPLSDRLPDYAAVFGIGLAGSTAVGVLIWLISDVSLASSVGYTIILYGIVLMLAGGATGGGYTNLGMGAVGALFGTRRADETQGEVGTTWSGRERIEPQERLARGLRPEANPRAFWQVMGGVAYVAIGLVVVVLFS